jgi:alpha-beta hydrolase superfamily lysophospholipase
MVHGLGGHSNNWEYMADYFQQRGIACYALELKGFGVSSGAVKGHIDSLNTYIRDIRRLYNIVRKDYKGPNVFLVGESMGGLTAFHTVIKKPGLFRGVVCMSPGFLSKLKITIPEYIKIISAWFYNQKKQFHMPFDGAMCTKDPKMQLLIDTDELEHRLATPKLLQSILTAQIFGRLFKNRIKTDTLFLLAGDDTFVCSKASRRIFDGMKLKNKQIIEYPGMRHSLSCDVGCEKVFEDTLRWMEKRIT